MVVRKLVESTEVDSRQLGTTTRFGGGTETADGFADDVVGSTMKPENGDSVRDSGDTDKFAVCRRRICVTVLLCLAAASCVQSTLAPRRFEDPSGSGTLDRVTVDAETGRVYAASTSGVVYQLTADLQLVDVYRAPSSALMPNDSATRLLELIRPTRTDNVEKNFARRKLLLYCRTDLCVALDCGGERLRPISRFDGVADVVPASNSSLLNVLLFVPDRLPPGVDTSTVALMYSAVNDGQQPTAADTLAALVLERASPDNSSSSKLEFGLRYRAQVDGFRSGIRLRSGRRARQMGGHDGGRRYVHAFDDGRFVYFVFVQSAYDGSVETRLARVCVDDDAFQSYTELVVFCRRRPTFQTYFGAAVAAVVAPMGAALARRLGERDGDDPRALYIAMGEADDGYGICVYPLEDVRREFTQAQRDCYRGSGRILASVDADEPRCTEDVSYE